MNDYLHEFALLLLNSLHPWWWWLNPWRYALGLENELRRVLEMLEEEGETIVSYEYRTR